MHSNEVFFLQKKETINKEKVIGMNLFFYLIKEEKNST